MFNIRILPQITKLSKFQREEYAKLWFDLSKISIGSLVVKLLEPSGPEVNSENIIIFISGLIIFLLCVRVGLFIGKETSL